MKSGAGRSNTAKAIGEANHDRKVDPSLSAAFDRWRVVKTGFESWSATRTDEGVSAAIAGARRESFKEVFITFDGDPLRFEDKGIILRAIAGNLATADASSDGLAALADDRDVLYVEESRPASFDAQGHMDGTLLAGPPPDWLGMIGADVLQKVLEERAVKGERTRVIVGVVDVDNLDIYHPAFSHPNNGGIRVLSMWDQTRDRDRPAKLGYGVEYSDAEIDKNLRAGNYSIPATAGHGAGVTGVAAGGGAVDPARRGVAPNADIIYVKTAESCERALSSMAKLADAIFYIFQEADRLGRPCVVCVSLGDTLGPHDGTSPVERFIDNLLTRPGRAVCISAGNLAPKKQTDGKHVSGRAGEGDTAVVDLFIPAGTKLRETIELWCSGDDEVELFIEAAGGPDAPIYTGAISAGMNPRFYEIGSSMRVIVSAVRRHPANGDNMFRIELVPTSDSVPEQTWKLNLVWRRLLNGSFDGWIDSNTPVRWRASSGMLDKITVLPPATSRFAMTVGSHEPDGSVAETSCCGPTRDGRLKPDITALGRDIMIPGPGGSYRNGHGTSFAAPQVAGAIALLFELYGPYLCMEDAKLLLGELANKEGVCAPDNHLGHGRLRLDKAASWAKAQPGEVWLPKHDRDQGGVPYVGAAPWMSPSIVVSNGNLTIEGEHEVTVKPRWEQSGPENTPKNAHVHLYWSDGASHVAEERWRSDGIFAGGKQANVQKIEPGQDAVFKIRPSRVKRLGAPARLISLKARVEFESDSAPRLLALHPLGRYQNNVAVRSVYRASSGDVDLGFWLTLPNGGSDLRFDASNLGGSEVTLRLPIGVIDLNAFPVFARALGTTFEEVPFEEHISLAARATIAEVLKGEEIVVRDRDILRAAGIEGAVEVKVSGTFTDVVVRPNEGGVLKATIDRLRGVPGHLMPARLIVRGAPMRTHDGKGTHLDMAQIARGAPIGGLRIEFRAA